MACLADQVLVVVPAHDEEKRLPACLRSIEAAALESLAAGTCRAVDVTVVAHRCTDRTVDLARSHRWPGAVTARVVEDLTSATVGEVRDGGARAAVLALGSQPDSTWLLSTDADSTVPPGWISGLLQVADARSTVAVTGMVELDDWAATPAARAAYERIIEAGITGPDTHTHAYAANLAVRLDAYLQVGGFPSVRHGEERGLVEAMVLAGLPVTSTRASVVRTSGRMPGRAAEGLGHLLDQLTAAGEVAPECFADGRV